MLDSLWTPTTLGGISLPHRLVMAPMTRDRSTPEGVYKRAERRVLRPAGLARARHHRGNPASADGQGYLLTPGIHNDEQIAGWRKVIDAVHAADGRIVIQLMHTGRIAHPDNTPTGAGRSPLRRSGRRA